MLKLQGLTATRVALAAAVVTLTTAAAHAQLENINLDNIRLDDIKVPTKSPDAAKTPPSPGEKTGVDADATSVPYTTMDAKAQQFWKMHWHTYAAKFGTDDGKRFFLCPKYTFRYPSSLGQTEEQFLRENTEVNRERVSSTLIQNVTTKPSREEVVAYVNSIPDLKPGEYGTIQSAEVVQVVNDHEMIVTGIWVVDEKQITKEIKDAEDRGDELYKREQERVKAIRERETRSSSYSTSSSSSRNNDGRGNERASYDRPNYGSGTSSNGTNTQPSFTKSDITKAIDQRYKYREELIKKQKAYGRLTVQLIGFPTRGAVPGKRWDGFDKYPNGPRVVIPVYETTLTSDGASTSSRRTSYSSRKTLTAVNAEMWNDAIGLTEPQFIQLLANRGMSQLDFVNTAQSLMREFGADEAEPMVLKELAEAKADAQAEAGADSPDSKGSLLDRKYGSKDGGSLLDRKYGSKDGDKSPGETDAKEGDAKSDKQSALERKYGKKDGKSFLERKYGKKDGDAKSDGEGEKDK
ncbi:MAG: hypothetical protein GC159_21095 [Phycisphaera sp.]|nr:hypothetical protein [Phycisphaera sp.]